MANVFYVNEDEFNTLVNGVPDPNTVAYIQNSLATIDPNMFSDTTFLDQAKQSFLKFGGSDAVLKARVLIDNIQSYQDPNVIRSLHTVTDFQTCSPLMQRYNMACPMLRDMARNDLCNGYMESYTDTDPNSSTYEHLDYLRSISGMAVVDENGMYIKEYADSADTEAPLSALDKFIIDNNWLVLEELLNSKGEDPTDVFGGHL